MSRFFSAGSIVFEAFLEEAGAHRRVTDLFLKLIQTKILRGKVLNIFIKSRTSCYLQSLRSAGMKVLDDHDDDNP